jgi:hypothetical protein
MMDWFTMLLSVFGSLLLILATGLPVVLAALDFHGRFTVIRNAAPAAVSPFVKYDGAVVVRLPTAIGGRVLDEKSANARSVAYGRFAQDK